MGKKRRPPKPRLPPVASSLSRYYIASMVCLAVAIVGMRLARIFLSERDARGGGALHVSSKRQEKQRWEVACAPTPEPKIPGCHVGICRRVMADGFIGTAEVTALIGIAEKAMHHQPAQGGPTIVDLNSGFSLGGRGLVNIYETGVGDSNRLIEITAKEYELYGGIVARLKHAVQDEFGLSELYFTAPTFITRLVGNNSWSPQTMHDEYWHTHVDKNNTDHYDYSGLLYLSDYGQDFEGGRLTFFDSTDEVTPAVHLEPARGRLLLFSAGQENPHKVEKVTEGRRYVLSFWFTCQSDFAFQNFLDGKAHKRYGESKISS